MGRWSAVHDEWDAAIELIQNVRCACGADPTEAICAWGGNRMGKFLHHRSKYRMRAHAKRDRIQTRGNQIRNPVRLRQKNGKRPRPEPANQGRNYLFIISINDRKLFNPRFIRYMHNERIEVW